MMITGGPALQRVLARQSGKAGRHLLLVWDALSELLLSLAQSHELLPLAEPIPIVHDLMPLNAITTASTYITIFGSVHVKTT